MISLFMRAKFRPAGLFRPVTSTWTASARNPPPGFCRGDPVATSSFVRPTFRFRRRTNLNLRPVQRGAPPPHPIDSRTYTHAAIDILQKLRRTPSESAPSAVVCCTSQSGRGRRERTMDDLGGQEPFASDEDANLENTSTKVMTLEDIVASFDWASSSYANAETFYPLSYDWGATLEQPDATTYQPEQSTVPEYNELVFGFPTNTVDQSPDPADAQQDSDWEAHLLEVQRFINEPDTFQEAEVDANRSMLNMPSLSYGGGEDLENPQHGFSAGGDQVGGLNDWLTSSESPSRVQSEPSPTKYTSDRENARGSSRRKRGSGDDLMAPMKRRRAAFNQSPAANTPSASNLPSVVYNFSLPAQTPEQSTSHQAPVVPAMTTANGSANVTNLGFPLGNQSTHMPMLGTASAGPASLVMPPSTGNIVINNGGTLFAYPGSHVTPSGKTRINAYNFGFKDGPDDTVSLFHGLTGGVELLVLFPNHTKWPQVMLRLLSSGWTTKEMAAVQLYARGGSQGNLKRRFATLRKQATTPSMYPSTDDTGTTPTANSTGVSIPPVSYYDTTSYLPVPKKVSKLHPVALFDIGRDIVNFPTQEDRGLLAQAVQWAVRTGDMTATTDDIQGLAQHHGWMYPADAGTDQWDQRGRTRMMVILRAAGWAV
ncbi:hypothetical protein LTR73_007673 [Friedmanniomyces endolithicus]|nr:hypothetical protein LTR73_007673 [Friedmanniomyces endolithicus]